ncbi:hypothetical protein [Herbidospora cretacea]|uniref:hypothetical protein n=1 Tax=Herbidospora cretacea TaxID=28444 RepID=UPI0007749521|nr:hypothetical protein [Herbidospora cretacea]
MTMLEKRAWVYLLVTVVIYAGYVVVILGRKGSGPLTDVDYVPVLLWSLGLSIGSSIVVGIVAGMIGERSTRTDVRDREIDQMGERVGQAFTVIGALGAFVLALLEAPYFWIANAIYLGFALTMIVGSLAKVVAYRRGGFQQW